MKTNFGPLARFLDDASANLPLRSAKDFIGKHGGASPLLGTAAAAHTEVGGPSAHAAIVAREFGISLAGWATAATRVITDGAKIVVNGKAGIVELESRSGDVLPERSRRNNSVRFRDR